MSPRWIEYLPIVDVLPAEVNPKKHAGGDLRASMARFGFTEPPLVDDRTGRLVAGHGRLEAAGELAAAEASGAEPPEGVELDEQGRWCIPVVRGWSSASDDEARAYLLTSNTLTEKGGWDEPVLLEWLVELDAGAGLDGIGYSSEEIAALLEASAVAAARSSAPDDASDDDDQQQEPPADPVTVRGDVWLLGPHRLLCGDCREPDDVSRLLDGARVNLAITSPPYADRRDYDEGSGFVPIHPDSYVAWFAPAAALVAEHLEPDGSWFVNIKPAAEGLDQELYVFDLVLAHAREWGWHFAAEFCWERNGIPGQVARRFKNQFEPVYQFARGEWKIRPDAVRTYSASVPVYDPTANLVMERQQGKRGMTSFVNPRPRRANHSTKAMVDSQGSGADVGAAVIEGLAYPGNRLPTFAGSHEALGHAAAFPVGLPAWFISAYTDPGDRVYDPFVGSGSSLLAAHQLERVGYGMELSPGYCDLICARFQRRTGIKPVHAGTGEAHDFTEDT